MTGLDPSDPRFERAVQRALDGFGSKLNSADRDDMAQEIRIALWRKGGPAPVRVARLAAIDWWRKEWGRARQQKGRSDQRGPRQVELLARWPTDDTPSPLDLVESREPQPDVALLWCMAQRALAHMGPCRYRNMLLLRYIHDLDMRDIGRSCGVSESRVSQLMPRAHAALLKTLMGTR